LARSRGWDTLAVMPNYRRLFIPGGTFFFTVVTHRRTAISD
jgi:hypothetical protein